MFELWLTTDAGLRLALLDYTLGFSASRIANGIGFFDGQFAVDFDTSFIKPDFMIQVWLYEKLWCCYFLRKWRFYTEDNVEYLDIAGPCQNDLLRRRIVAAYAGGAVAKKSIHADDMMKEVVTQSMLDTAEPTPDAGTRAWANLTVAPDDSLGPSIQKAFAWDKLLVPSGGGVLPELAQAAEEEGTPVYFDIVPDVVAGASISFLFQTYINQPGLDVSDRVTFSKENGNLKDPYYEENWTDEENYVYAGGQNQGVARNVQQVYDSARYGVSQWGRCEGFADARNQSAGDEVKAAGYAYLWNHKPKKRFGGVPLDTEGTQFGRDWDFGYRVRAEYRGVSYTPIIKTLMTGAGSDGKPFVQARLECSE